jgi:hypothetical protein
MTVLIEPFASVYYDRSRLGVIFARGRNGFEAYAADDHSLGLFPVAKFLAKCRVRFGIRPHNAHARVPLQKWPRAF